MNKNQLDLLQSYADKIKAKNDANLSVIYNVLKQDTSQNIYVFGKYILDCIFDADIFQLDIYLNSSWNLIDSCVNSLTANGWERQANKMATALVNLPENDLVLQFYHPDNVQQTLNVYISTLSWNDFVNKMELSLMKIWWDGKTCYTTNAQNLLDISLKRGECYLKVEGIEAKKRLALYISDGYQLTINKEYIAQFFEYSKELEDIVVHEIFSDFVNFTAQFSIREFLKNKVEYVKFIIRNNDEFQEFFIMRAPPNIITKYVIFCIYHKIKINQFLGFYGNKIPLFTSIYSMESEDEIKTTSIPDDLDLQALKIFDPILLEELRIDEFLDKDPNNIVIINQHKNQYFAYGTNIVNISKYLRNNNFLECKEANGKFSPDNMKDFYKWYTKMDFGTNIVIPTRMISYLLTKMYRKYRIFIAYQSSKLNTTSNLGNVMVDQRKGTNIFSQLVNIVSGWHCGDGTSVEVWKIDAIETPKGWFDWSWWFK